MARHARLLCDGSGQHRALSSLSGPTLAGTVNGSGCAGQQGRASPGRSARSGARLAAARGSPPCRAVPCRACSLSRPTLTLTLTRAGAGEASLQDFLAANPDFLEQAGELEGAGLAGALGSGLPSALAGGMDADPSPIMRFSSDGSMMEQLMRTASSKCAARAGAARAWG